MSEDEPTQITREMLNEFMKIFMNQEIKTKQCFKCGIDYYGGYGGHIGECDECFFSRFPKEQVEDFYRSFF